MFPCALCSKRFRYKASLKKHLTLAHPFRCRQCTTRNCRFSTMRDLKDHHASHHAIKRKTVGYPPKPPVPKLCRYCDRLFPSEDYFALHWNLCSKMAGHKFQPKETAFSETCSTYEMVFKKRKGSTRTEMLSPEILFDYLLKELLPLLKHEVNVKRRMYFSVIPFAHMEQIDPLTNIVVKESVLPLRTQRKSVVVAHPITEDQLREMLFDWCVVIGERLEVVEVDKGDSGWHFTHFEKVQVEIARRPSLSGRGGVVPKKMRGSKYLLCHPDAPPDYCFLYSIAHAFLPRNATVVQLQDFVRRHMHHDFFLPTSLRDIEVFEKVHVNLNVAINVLLAEGAELHPVRVSPRYKADRDAVKVINLLMLPRRDDKELHKREGDGDWVADSDGYSEDEDEDEDGDEVEGRGGLGMRQRKSYRVPSQTPDMYHYCLIVDIDEFVRVFHRKDEHAEVCLNCLVPFISENAFKNHQELCLDNHPQAVKFPKEGDKLKFSLFKALDKKTFFAVYDFECKMTAVPYHEQADAGATRNRKIIYRQDMVSFVFLLCDYKGKILMSRQAVQEDGCIQRFLDVICEASDMIGDLVDGDPHKMQISQEDNMRYFDAKLATHETARERCYFCDEIVFAEDVVKHHSHYPPHHFIGLAHARCNVNATPRFETFPCFAHNSSSYDLNIIIRGLAERDSVRNVRGIARNAEKLRTISYKKFQFLDSLDFLQSSLAELVESVKETDCVFPLLQQFCPDSSKRLLLMRKNVFPYEHFTSVREYYDLHTFPPREAFYSRLHDESITEEAYLKGKEVFDIFDCRNMVDYLMLYNNVDVYLLADIVFHFRNVLYDLFGLCVHHCISLPQYSFQCMLRATKVEIELLHDYDMHLMFEKSIRGGISNVHLRKSEYQAGQQLLVYLDVNALYSHSLAKPLPVSDFRWLSEEETRNVDWLTQEEDQQFGWILTVDLEYPQRLHESHSSFPLAPENVEIRYDDLSPLQQTILRQLGRTNHKSRKLVGHFKKRTQYTLHYMNLKYYLQSGLILKKIHKCVQFRQDAFMTSFVKWVGQLRAQQTSKFNSSLFKSILNQNFGKFMATTKDHTDVRFCTTQRKINNALASPRFVSYVILNERFVICLLRKKYINLTRQSLAIGTTILESSKLYMAQLFYDKIVPRFDRVQLCYTDTDSFILQVKCPSLHSFYETMADLMDFSNFPQDHPLYDKSKKNRIGLLKDEARSKVISKVICVRPKCYVVEMVDDCDSKDYIKRSKGTPKRIVDRMTDIEHYQKVVDNIAVRKAPTYTKINSRCFELYTDMIYNRLMYSSFEDKKFYTCLIHGFNYGDYRIQSLREQFGRDGAMSCPTCLE